MPPNNFQNQIDQLKQTIKDMEVKYLELLKKHQHNGNDGTNVLRKGIELDEGQYIRAGLGWQGSLPTTNRGTASEQMHYAISIGPDDGRRGVVTKADILQFNLLHQPNNTSKQSFITAFRTPICAPLQDQTISVTAGGSTVTIAGYDFTTNELAGAYINIFNSSGTFIESRPIASNTDTVITITGTWGATTSGGTYFIYAPVFYGSAEYINQRFYAQEGTAGGIRFGVGPTAGGQNGLLYMDSAGDLYWRDKGGSSIQLNVVPAP